MKIKLLRWGIIGLIVISISGCYFLPEEEKPVEAPVLIETQEELYSTTEATRGDLQITSEGIGSLIASEMEAIKFKTGGKIKVFYVQNGDTVKTGDLLAEIEVGDIEEEILLAEIDLEKQGLLLEETKLNAQKMAKQNSQALENKKIELEGLNNSLEETDKRIEVNQSLYNLGGLSEQELKASQNVLKEQQLKVKTLETEIENLQTSIDAKEQEIAVRKGELDYKEADIRLESLKENLAAAKLYSPVDGAIVFKTDTLEGEYISSEAIIFQIAKTDDFYVEYVGDLAGQFKVDEQVILQYDNKDYRGVVIMNPRTAPTENASVYEKTARFRFDSIGEVANPIKGKLVKITKLIAESKNTIIVPSDVVQSINGKPYVNVLENDIRVQKNVETGLYNNAYTEIKQGIEEGEIIILR